MSTKLKLGLLLPHFCEHASVANCLEGATRAEAYGFDSVWVRDHLVFEPHGIEGSDNTHIEGLLVLSAIAAVTNRISTRYFDGDLSPPSDSSRPALCRLERDLRRSRHHGNGLGWISARVRRGRLSERVLKIGPNWSQQRADLPRGCGRRNSFFPE